MFIKRSNLIFIVASFLTWKVLVLIFAAISIKVLPLFSHNYLGGGYNNYIQNSLFWGHVNFDGEHYLSIAQSGYRPLEYFFFPLYPSLISILTFTKTLSGYVSTGVVISNITFLFSLISIYKLVRIDFEEKIAQRVVILFLVFPVSFYFGLFYTESLFLCLVLWCLYFARNKNFLLASIFAAFASYTRIIGIALLPVLLVELALNRKKAIVNLLEILLISPLGLLIYMNYLLKQTGDPLIFLHQVSIFGDQRSSTFILLPQVIYRYIFKILPVISNKFLPIVFTTYMEFMIAVIFIGLILYGVFKIRLSYSLYACFAFIIPTLAGSFSSMPRYALVVFPVFISTALFMEKLPKIFRILIFFVMLIFMAFSTALFWRGYWIS